MCTVVAAASPEADSDAEAGGPPLGVPQALDGAEGDHAAYETDLEYLEDAFQLVLARVRRYALDLETEKDSEGGETLLLRARQPRNVMRELRAKERQAEARWGGRLAATRCVHALPCTASHLRTSPPRSTRNAWLPRAERLRQRLRLDDFEVMVVLSLVGSVLSTDLRKALKANYVAEVDVGLLLALHCPTLREQVGVVPTACSCL